VLQRFLDSLEKLYTIDGGIDDWVKNNLPVVDGKK